MADDWFEIDYFISRRGTHAAVAQEVADVLKSIGATSFSQDHDISYGANFIAGLHEALARCKHFIALLTVDYDESPFVRAEWTNFYAAHVQSNEQRRFILIRLEDFQPSGLMSSIVLADLVGRRFGTRLMKQSECATRCCLFFRRTRSKAPGWKMR